MILTLTNRKTHKHQQYQVADVMEDKANGLILTAPNKVIAELELDMATEEPVSGSYGNWSWVIN